MSISETITSMNTNLSLAYSKCAEKGATIPENKNLENLADTIDTVSGGSEQPYIFLDYIQSSGTQWINTGYVFTTATNVKTKVNVSGLNITSSSYEPVFGSTDQPNRYGSSWAKMLDFYVTYGGNTPGYRRAGAYATGSAFPMNTDVTIQTNIRSITYNGNTISLSSSYSLESGASPIAIFTVKNNANNNPTPISGTMKLYYFQVFENDIMVREYIPAIRTSDNTVGLYEKNEGKFYSNQGTGVFIAGPSMEHKLTAIYVDKYGQTEYEVGDSFSLDGYTIKAVYSDGAKVDVTSECTFTPSTLASDTTSVTISYTENGVTETCDVDVNASPYIFVDYIQSTGTQYINTGVNGGSEPSYEIEFQALSPNQEWTMYFAGDNATNLPKIFGRRGYYCVDLGKDAEGLSRMQVALPFPTSRINYKVYSNKAVRDDTYEYTYSKQNVTSFGTLTWWIFSSHSEPSLYSKMKLYKLKMWAGSTLIRDFVPVVRKTDNAVGLLDKVNNVFYGNNGSGTFLFG